MDAETLAVAIQKAKEIPGTAAQRAEAAQAAAETAADLAKNYGYSLTIEGTALVIGEEVDDG